MDTLQQATAEFVRITELVKGNPLLFFIWTVTVGTLTFLLPRIPWLRLWRVMPWQHIPLSDAAAKVLDGVEETRYALMARKAIAPDQTLHWIATYISSNCPTTGTRPPGTKRHQITKKDLAQCTLSQDCNALVAYGDKHPRFAELKVRRWRLPFIVRGMIKADKAIYPNKARQQ